MCKTYVMTEYKILREMQKNLNNGNTVFMISCFKILRCKFLTDLLT